MRLAGTIAWPTKPGRVTSAPLLYFMADIIFSSIAQCQHDPLPVIVADDGEDEQ